MVAHDLGELAAVDARGPAELLFGFAEVAQEQVDFGGSEVAGVDLDVLLPVELEVLAAVVEEVADGMGLASRQDVVVRFVLLEHHPHSLDIILGVAPVAFGIEVAEVKLFLQAELDPGQGSGDFAGHERLAAAG